MMKRLFLITALVAAVLPANLAAAWHCPRWLIDEASLGPIGWVAYRLDMDNPAGHDFGWGMSVRHENSEASAAGMWLVDETGSPVTGWVGVASDTQSYQMRLSGADQDVHVSYSSGYEDTYGIVIWELRDPGIYYFVAAVAGQGQVEATAEICGDFDVLNKTTGDEGFIFHDQDFAGTLAAYVGAPEMLVDAPVAGRTGFGRIAAHVGLGLSQQTQVESSLFGSFQLGGLFPSADVAEMGYDGPAGRVGGSTRYLFAGEDPGAYRFWVDRLAGAPWTGLWAWGADVTLPS